MPQVAILLGSESDRSFVDSSKMLVIFDQVGVDYELSFCSAHRHPDELTEYCRAAPLLGVRIFIAAASMSAALPGAVAAATYRRLPVLAVALPSPEYPSAQDALLSITRMPPGVPLLATGIGVAGLQNAAIAACQILAVSDTVIADGLSAYLVGNTPTPKMGERSSSYRGGTHDTST